MKSLGNLIALLVLFFVLAVPVFAQVGGHGIPVTYELDGENITTGDIISFNPLTNVYRTAIIPRDKDMFGVVEENPVVVLRTGTGRVPIVQVGEVFVNVTSFNGPIEVGDKITSSRIAGKGAKFTGSSDGFILGIALESFSANATSSQTVEVEGESFALGQIRVLLSIGPAQGDSVADDETRASTIFVREDPGEVSSGLETIFRYITAVLFTLGTLFVVLKTFGPNIGKGVTSIGRNPLAKTSIQAMVVFNIVLIVAIVSVSFIISLLIIFLPI